jgi:hypothetical protein
MPRVLPTGAANVMQQRLGLLPIVLVDLTTWDGSTFYWTDFTGSYPRRLDGASQEYTAMVKSAGPFRHTRSLRTDAGNLIIQNMSGARFRDAGTAMTAHEFEGSLCIVRYWSQVLSAAIYEFDGFLSEPALSETEANFRVLQLLDASITDVPLDDYSETCSLRFKGPLCGSTSSNPTCDHTLAVCTSGTSNRARFNGTPNPPPLTVVTPNVVPPPAYNPNTNNQGWIVRNRLPKGL